MSWQQTYHLIETKRIRDHLERTEKALLAKDISHLSDEMKYARVGKIKLLHEYWIALNYPINTKHPQKVLPHIKDEFGTPCAMAYLIEQSGGKAEHELIEYLYKNNNNVFIKDVHDGPVIDWINKSGITKDEACRIQPQYAFENPIERDKLFKKGREFIKREQLRRSLPKRKPTPSLPKDRAVRKLDRNGQLATGLSAAQLRELKRRKRIQLLQERGLI